MQAGRVRGKGKTAPTSIQALNKSLRPCAAAKRPLFCRTMYRLRKKGAMACGWTFFGKPAYTMTLAGKLAQVKGVKALFFCGERLPDVKALYCTSSHCAAKLNGDKENDARVINENTEYWIRRFPEQYLFMYNRYKHPRRRAVAACLSGIDSKPALRKAGFLFWLGTQKIFFRLKQSEVQKEIHQSPAFEF